VDAADLTSINEALEQGKRDDALRLLCSLAEHGDPEAMMYLADDSFRFGDKVLANKWRAAFDEMVSERNPTALYIRYTQLSANGSVKATRIALQAAVDAGSAEAMVELARAYRWGWLKLQQSERKYDELIRRAIENGSSEAIAESVFDKMRERQPIPQTYIDKLESEYKTTTSSRVRDAVEALRGKERNS